MFVIVITNSCYTSLPWNFTLKHIHSRLQSTFPSLFVCCCFFFFCQALSLPFFWSWNSLWGCLSIHTEIMILKSRLSLIYGCITLAGWMRRQTKKIACVKANISTNRKGKVKLWRICCMCFVVRLLLLLFPWASIAAFLILFAITGWCEVTFWGKFICFFVRGVTWWRSLFHSYQVYVFFGLFSEWK